MSEQNKALVLNFIHCVNVRDWEGLRTLLAPHFVRHSQSAGDPEVRSADELVSFLKNECITFPDAQETVLDLVAEGQRLQRVLAFSAPSWGVWARIHRPAKYSLRPPSRFIA